MLQLVQNGCVRMKRLVRNMVVQLGGCVTPGNSIGNEENEGERSSPVLAERMFRCCSWLTPLERRCGYLFQVLLFERGIGYV